MRAVARSFFETFVYLAKGEFKNSASCFVWSLLGIGYVVLGSIFPKTIYGSFATLTQKKDVDGKERDPESQPKGDSPDNSPKPSPRDDSHGRRPASVDRRFTSHEAPRASSMPILREARPEKVPTLSKAPSFPDIDWTSATEHREMTSSVPANGAAVARLSPIAEEPRSLPSAAAPRPSSSGWAFSLSLDAVQEPAPLMFSPRMDISNASKPPKVLSQRASLLVLDSEPSAVTSRTESETAPRSSGEIDLDQLLPPPLWHLVGAFADFKSSAWLLQTLAPSIERQDCVMDISPRDAQRWMQESQGKHNSALRRGLVQQCILRCFKEKSYPQPSYYWAPEIVAPWMAQHFAPDGTPRVAPLFKIVSERRGPDGGTIYGIKVSICNVKSVNKHKPTRNDVNPVIKNAFNLLADRPPRVRGGWVHQPSEGCVPKLREYGVLGQNDSVVIEAIDCSFSDLSARAILGSAIDLEKITDVDLSATRITSDTFLALDMVPNLEKLTINFCHSVKARMDRYRMSSHSARSAISDIPSEVMSDAQKEEHVRESITTEMMRELLTNPRSIPCPKVKEVSCIGIMIDRDWFKVLSKFFPNAKITFTPSSADYRELAISEQEGKIVFCPAAIRQLRRKLK